MLLIEKQNNQQLMINIKYLISKKFNVFLSIIFISLILSSCATLSHVDKAQEQFNKGAEIDNMAFFDQANSNAIPPLPADYFYKAAIAETDKALKNKPKLKKLEVYVNTLTLKSLSQWKLERYQAADETAKEALTYMKDKNMTVADFPRDFGVLKSMSALIGIEEMNKIQENYFKQDNISSDAAKSQYNQIVYKEAKKPRNLEKDLEDLNNVSSQISADHEIQSYLSMSKLSALKVWSDALDATKQKMKDNGDFRDHKDWHTSEKEALNPKITNALSALKNQVGSNNDAFKFWQSIFPNN